MLTDGFTLSLLTQCCLEATPLGIQLYCGRVVVSLAAAPSHGSRVRRNRWEAWRNRREARRNRREAWRNRREARRNRRVQLPEEARRNRREAWRNHLQAWRNRRDARRNRRVQPPGRSALFIARLCPRPKPHPLVTYYITFAIGIPQWKYDFLFINFCKK